LILFAQAIRQMMPPKSKLRFHLSKVVCQIKSFPQKLFGSLCGSLFISNNQNLANKEQARRQRHGNEERMDVTASAIVWGDSKARRMSAMDTQ